MRARAYREGMKSVHLSRRLGIVLTGAIVFSAGAVGAAFAAGGDDDAQDRPIPAGDLDRAARVAVQEIGEGTVTETEIDDEESKYEVEVTLPDGAQVDVQLDEQFRVVGTEGDSETDHGDDD